MARLTIRIEFANGRAIGPGKIRLLELVEQEGSIRGAAIAMGMSYRRAWLLIHEMEAMMATPVVVAASGGTGGGGTKLTPRGRAVVDRYRSLEVRAARSVDRELRALSKMTNTSVRARALPARLKRSTPRRKPGT
jgi:molybdate transport system regulatory protein